MATLRDLVNVRSQRALRLRAHLESLANGSAWRLAPWLRQARHTLDAVYVEPDVVRWDRGRQPETADQELRAAVAPSHDGRTRERWAEAWHGVSRGVILGRPGEGKTTFLQCRCQRLAAESLALWTARATRLGDLPLPIWLRAEDIIRQGSVEAALGIETFGTPESAPKALSVDDRRAALRASSTCLFIDALDERPAEVGSAEAVAALESLRAVPARIVLSVRAYAWRATDLPFTISTGERTVGANGAPLVVYELAPLTRQQRADVVARWCAADADRREQLTGLLDVAPMRELTSNALLLTLFCAAATADPSRTISSATRRAELYAWLAIDLVTRADRNPLPPNSREAQDRLLVLARAAWTLWQTHPGGPFPYQDWVDALREACGDRQVVPAVYQALQREVEQTGLLVADRERRRFFPQAVFEYLAGAELVQDAALTPGGPAQITQIARTLANHAGETTWREMSLLAIGHLAVVRRKRDLAGSIVASVLGARKGPPGAAVALVGEALVEAGATAVPKDVCDRTVARLNATMRSAVPRGRTGHVPATTRARAGTALGWLGDRRFRPDRWWLPDEPLLGFVKIPEGPFTMGSDPKRDPSAFQHERDAHPVTLQRYFIARFPVTVAQFRAFVEDGENVGFTPEDPDCLTGVPNHPVVYVTWHEALLYCRWLGRKLGRDGPAPLRRLLNGPRDERWSVTLPSEAEWERAARGRRARIYPWGEQWDADAANAWESNIHATSAVGCFPRGAAPRPEGGVEELCGNVWEWTRSLWGPEWEKPEFRYPYEPDYRGRERENLSAPDDVFRVVRGGSFRDYLDDARAAIRFRYYPVNRFYLLGFRVVVSPFVDPLDL